MFFDPNRLHVESDYVRIPCLCGGNFGLGCARCEGTGKILWRCAPVRINNDGIADDIIETAYGEFLDGQGHNFFNYV